jgi:predicted enzyme related to lactoylglutathione lyase
MSSSPSTLNWVNIFAGNLQDLPSFYSDLFGFEEIEYMRNDVFRGFATGGSCLGFLSPDVYDLLHLEEWRDASGASFLLNFEAPTCEEVDRLVTAAVAGGATLRKAAYRTAYGWYQAVLIDPEGNVFRINHILGENEAVHA